MNKEQKTVLIQIGLFIATFITTTLAGAEWVYGRFIHMPDYTWADFVSGMEFSIPFLLILTVHEFGHYFTAMYHKIRASLPYYIPIPSILVFSIGTLGAVIRIRDHVRSNIQHFDIGLAGPLAGFIAALAIVGYGFATLPPAEHIYNFHPEYKTYGLDYGQHVYKPEYTKERRGLDIQVGSNLLFELFGYFVEDKSRIPNPHEMMHYPLLLAGFIALFFTSMNLLPIGQLDGGHITYGLFGHKGHKRIATIFFVLLLFYSGLGFVSAYESREKLVWMVPLTIGFYYLCFHSLGLPLRDRIMYALLLFAVHFILSLLFPTLVGYSGWFLFALLIGRFIGIQHPRSEIEQPLDGKRILLGWLSLLIFILCFSPAPLHVIMH